MFPGVVGVSHIEEDGGSLRQGDDAEFAFQTATNLDNIAASLFENNRSS